MQRQISQSATGPAIGLIIGLLLFFSGSNPIVASLGALIMFGSGVLFAVRLFWLLTSPRDNRR